MKALKEEKKGKKKVRTSKSKEKCIEQEFGLIKIQ